MTWKGLCRTARVQIYRVTPDSIGGQDRIDPSRDHVVVIARLDWIPTCVGMTGMGRTCESGMCRSCGLDHPMGPAVRENPRSQG